MVKFVVFCAKVIAATIVAVLFSSCHANIDWGNGLDGNSKVIIQKRNLENNFSKIKISRGLNLYIEQAENYSIEVEADENLQEHITTKVENGTLVITSDSNIDEAKAKNIRVKLPLLTSLEATSGSTVSSTGKFDGTDIQIKTNSGSETNLSLEIDNIICESSSGSSINLRGKALYLTTTSSSGSSIDASDLLANEITSNSTSGSSTSVHPLVSLKGKASSGSSINYNGSPKTVTKEESSGGSISKI